MPALGSLSAVATYLALFALVFAESGVLLGFFLPGDTVLLAVGALSAGRSPHLSLTLLLLTVVPAAVLGDALGYWTGARAGRAVLQRRPGRVRGLDRATRFYGRYGWLAVVSARWVPWLRVVTPVLAGAAGMGYGRFVTANVLGAACWGAGLLVAGHVAAQLG